MVYDSLGKWPRHGGVIRATLTRIVRYNFGENDVRLALREKKVVIRTIQSNGDLILAKPGKSFSVLFNSSIASYSCTSSEVILPIELRRDT